ncbi:MAG: hypothetical protein QXI92_05435 [Candidatus Nitrosocaldus sp.]
MMMTINNSNIATYGIRQLPLRARVFLALVRARLSLFSRLDNILLQEAPKVLKPIQELSEAERDALIRYVAGSTWARRIAEGQAKFAGLVVGTEEWNRFVDMYSRNLARRILGL